MSLRSQLDNAFSNAKPFPARLRFHRVHRVAMATFWRTFHHEGKIIRGWWKWWCTQLFGSKLHSLRL
jgi:hypothetical protein